ncbi:protein-disulfide reductase DsbD family protein [Kiloniella majae]|uniref:protein-disulfide reductase DsbD family protein n=1 Tax=Kiloniella majae TaxID=1938558 RepID=UPI000A277925|nr:protein-disulfide reductase DsbD domain-containing protein [Kiloniella majae]
MHFLREKINNNLRRVLLGIFFVFFALFSVPFTAQGSSSPWIEEEFSRVRLVTGQETLGDAGKVMLGLQFELKEGWKTYWRSPGDAGFPVSLDLAGSENLKSWQFYWPVPHRFTLFGLQTFGYSKEVVFPFEIQANDPQQDVTLRGTASYLLCKEICIPFDAEVTIRLPAGEAFPSLEAGIVDAYVRQVPGLGAETGLDITDSFLDGEGEDLVLKVYGSTKEQGFQKPDVIVEGPPGFSFSGPEVVILDDGSKAEFTIPVSSYKETKGVLEGKQITLSLVDGTKGVEFKTVSRYKDIPVGTSLGVLAFLPILGLALLGGFILNLMPCVLPVLSLKLMSVIRHEDGDDQGVRRSFIATSLGILTSFWILAAAASLLKVAGFSVGWGIQFQQPLFLIAMSGIVSLFAANLFGWFEFVAPGGMMNRAVSASEKQGSGGDFLKGMFATLLATPCSAPFLGTAVGFALARGTWEIFAIFTFLGIGMSLPYLAVAAKPKLAMFLPKPGIWMIWLKSFLGLLLLGTVAWLLSVLFVQMGWLATTLVAGLLALGMAILAIKSLTIGKRALAVAFLAILSLAVPYKFSVSSENVSLSDYWIPFAQQQIAGEVGSGRIVFVDVTADWCITCQVNKKLVLEQDEIQSLLQQENVVPMQADWTLPSDTITAYLESYNRYGIPFNIIYGPGAPDGIVLSELLTIDEVLSAFEQASGKQ